MLWKLRNYGRGCCMPEPGPHNKIFVERLRRQRSFSTSSTHALTTVLRSYLTLPHVSQFFSSAIEQDEYFLSLSSTLPLRRRKQSILPTSLNSISNPSSFRASGHWTYHLHNPQAARTAHNLCRNRQNHGVQHATANIGPPSGEFEIVRPTHLVSTDYHCGRIPLQGQIVGGEAGSP